MMNLRRGLLYPIERFRIRREVRFMKNRTKQRILSVTLSILMCLWLMPPAAVWGTEPDASAPETAVENPELLDSAGTPAAEGFLREKDEVVITANGNWTAVYRTGETRQNLSVSEGFCGSVTVRTLDAETDARLSEQIFVFEGGMKHIRFKDDGSGAFLPVLTEAPETPAPVYQPEHPADITALSLDGHETALPAVPDGASLSLVLSDKNHTLSVTYKDSRTAAGELIRDGNGFVLQTPKENVWTTPPAISGWTFGQTPSVPSGASKYGTPVFSYSADKNGPYTSASPTSAGTWYLKAEVAETDAYTGLSEIVAFEVTLGSSTVILEDRSMDKPYDGLPVKAPAVQKTGSTKDVRFLWSRKSDSGWIELTDAPVHAGQYKVTAILDGDSGYGAASAEKTFTISAASNIWTEEPSIADFAYKDTPNPLAKAAFGTPVFTYSPTKDGIYGELPDSAPAGTWYLKAEVPATDDYSGLLAIVEFHITKAPAPELLLPENLTTIQDAPLSFVTLPDGWIWAAPEQKATVGVTGYPARFAVDDQNYDYSSAEGYHEDGHYVERLLPVAVSIGKNTWIEGLTIDDWTYGQAPSVPNAKAEHGKVTFTYSADPDGTFTDKVPEHAGIWYVRAVADGGSEYESLSLTEQFVIRKAVPKPELPEINAYYGQTLGELKLPDGFSFKESAQTAGNVGRHSFGAVYTPADTANYEILTDLTLSVNVQKAKNGFVKAPSLKGWSYGSKANTPAAETVFGTPYFLYSQKADGKYAASVPTDAGTWYLKAVTDGTDNYSGITSDPVSFVIEPKAYEANGSIVIPDIDGSTDLSRLAVKDGDTLLKQGTDYEIEKTLKDKTMSVTLTFKGNYKGTVVKTYTASEEEIKAYQEAQRKKSVQTGDETMTEFWAVLCILSLSVLLILICVLRVRKKTRNLSDF